MLPGIGSRIETAVTLGALVTIFALSVPVPAFAAPAPPPPDPDCLMDPTNPECQYTGSNVPTNADDARCNAMPLSIGCQGGAYDTDDTNDWPRLPGEPPF